MKNCPICNKKLCFNEAIMRNYSWSDPSVTCTNCNFNYTEKIKDHRYKTNGIMMSQFKHEEIHKDYAEQKLFKLFDIIVTEKVVKTKREFN